LYRSQGESLISSNGWDATLDAPATGRYNCHSYTWNVSENGSERWLNAWYDGDIDYYNGSVAPTYPRSTNPPAERVGLFCFFERRQSKCPGGKQGRLWKLFDKALG